MRDRLVELLLADVGCDKDGRGDCSMCEHRYSEEGCIKHLATLLADHLLANGVIAPPCKVGDTVWFELYGQIESAVIYHCTYELTRKGCVLSGAYAKDTRDLELSFNENSIGKAVFLTRDEAEQALKG